MSARVVPFSLFRHLPSCEKKPVSPPINPSSLVILFHPVSLHSRPRFRHLTLLPFVYPCPSLVNVRSCKVRNYLFLALSLVHLFVWSVFYSGLLASLLLYLFLASFLIYLLLPSVLLAACFLFVLPLVHFAYSLLLQLVACYVSSVLLSACFVCSVQLPLLDYLVSSVLFCAYFVWSP